VERKQDIREEKIRELLGQVADVIALRRLTREERERIEELELEAEKAGAAGGAVPFVNEGVTEALRCEDVFAVLTGPMRRNLSQPWTVYLDDEDQLIGEWLPADKVEEARRNRRCVFLSDDFVLYKDRKSVGRGRFVMPFIELEDEAEGGAKAAAGIGCPSGPADLYLRSLMGEPGPEVATLVVGICRQIPSENEESNERVGRAEVGGSRHGGEEHEDKERDDE
jgi:hypothetical protein